MSFLGRLSVSGAAEAASWLSLLLVSLFLAGIRQRWPFYRPFLGFLVTGALLRTAAVLTDPIFTLPLLPGSWPAFDLKLLVFATLVQAWLLPCLAAALGRRAGRLRWLALGGLALQTAALALLATGQAAARLAEGLLIGWWSLSGLLAVAGLLLSARRRPPSARLAGLLLAVLPLVLAAVAGPLAAALLPPLVDTLAAQLAIRLPWLFCAWVLFALSLSEMSSSCRHEADIDLYASDMATSVSRFIPSEFLRQLSKDNLSDLRLGDHIKKDMTIFFSDIRAFTELSEGLTPEENFAFINSYFSRMVPLIDAHGGFVDKYMGDGIMALFPAENGADGALQVAVEMQKKMTEYNGHRAKMDYRAISLGVGLHTGTLMLGVVGVADHMEGTVVSDAVNLSSRLQSIAKAFNLATVISEATFMALNDPGHYKYRFIGKVRVKGKSDPVSVFEIFDGLPPDLFERKMKSNRFFEQAILAYYQKDYPDAVFYFKQALDVVPEDGAARFYLELCLRRTMGGKK
ncbi:MAG TPA: hypothetical protein DD477_08580 [Spirochaetaceae bacterium]|nr:MAG: hypothetical protein A2Y32_11340 [Spirochaetes bacterium GWF1_60_12]HBO41256.1 hypothetical protein [Spirochaetaceae bacterium]